MFFFFSKLKKKDDVIEISIIPPCTSLPRRRGREEIRSPLKTPAGEANLARAARIYKIHVILL